MLLGKAVTGLQNGGIYKDYYEPAVTYAAVIGLQNGGIYKTPIIILMDTESFRIINSQVNMTLYHYTTLENLPLIVKSDHLEFLLTDYMDFDDPSEGRKMWEVIREVDKKWVEDIWERFVISFCIENDNLAMLKEYANNASGVVLAINSDYLDRGTLFQCRYDTSIIHHIKDRIIRIKEDFKEKNKDWRANTQERAYIKREMAKLLAIKDPHYNYEQEWRLRMSGRMENVVFQFKRGRLRQRYPMIVDIKALEKIYLGPNNNPSVIDEIKMYLRYTTIPKMEVEMLKVPYRSN